MRIMITEKNLIRHEFIGLFAEVCESKNEAQIGIEGKVVDETRDTLKIEENGDIKIIPKEGSEFIFEVPSNGKIKVKGDIVKSRPEDRIGKKYKKW